MTSKIINMAERLKDDEDRLLESLFASEPVADNGFSKQIVRRVRRKLFVRRMTLPLAALIGGSFAFKPLAALVTTTYQVLQQLPGDVVGSATSSLPSLQLIVTGGLILVAAILSVNMLED